MNGMVEVRRATPEDAAVCAGIVHGWVLNTAWIAERFSVDELTEMIAEAMPERDIWLAGTPPEGYLSLNPVTAQIGALYTSSPGNGLGKALLDQAKVGRDYLQLWTHEPNGDAHRFYRREGFEVVERNPLGDDGLPELRMEWKRDGAET